MDLYIGNLPEQAIPSDLYGFFGSLARKASFRFAYHYHADGDISRYAVASFDSERAALKAITKFNRQPLYGKPLHIREFFYRSYSNERRALGWRNQPWDGIERRQEERRNHRAFDSDEEFKKILEAVPSEEQETPVIQAYGGMARKY